MKKRQYKATECKVTPNKWIRDNTKQMNIKLPLTNE